MIGYDKTLRLVQSKILFSINRYFKYSSSITYVLFFPCRYRFHLHGQWWFMTMWEMVHFIYIFQGGKREKNHIERKSLMLATSGGKICFHGRSADPGNIPFQCQSTLILAHRFKNMFLIVLPLFLFFLFVNLKQSSLLMYRMFFQCWQLPTISDSIMLYTTLNPSSTATLS